MASPSEIRNGGGSTWRRAVLVLLAAGLLAGSLRGQVETVPAFHPVYGFLKRLEVKGLIGRYFDAVLPLSRRAVAEMLRRAERHSASLSRAERELLEEYGSEFRMELSGSLEGFHSVIGSGAPGPSEGIEGELGSAEKFLFAYRDSAVSLFVNGLLTLDGRRSFGDAGDAGATFLQFGGRLRGTVGERVGFSLQATNAQFWGSRELLQSDPVIGQSFALGTRDAQNFDFVEGYARYDDGLLSAQVGRERVLWGNGYEQKMVASENVRVYDFVRLDAEYRAVKYTFLHAWLLGRRNLLVFTHPADTSATLTEPVVADKYFAAHRIELSFPGVVDFGAQEMVIYSHRAPDLAYLNPVTLIESAQRAREERDNVFWAIDVQLHALTGIELSGTILFDDLHLAEFFENLWYNRYAYQAGVMLVDPPLLQDVTLAIEYTRVEPYTFAHNRSRDNDYGSLGAVLGPRIGPNADAWSFRADIAPSRNLALSAGVTLIRRGENIVDAGGTLIRNVGGDLLQPHRDTDPVERRFLDGVRFADTRAVFAASWQVLHQLWLETQCEIISTRNRSEGTSMTRSVVAAQARIEF